MNLIIDRKKWYRGLDPSRSRLLRGDGDMCCLGFMMKECGLESETILDVAYPAGLCINGVPTHKKEFQKLFKKMDNDLIDYNKESHECVKLIDINDNEMPESVRESKLTNVFKSIGVNVSFIN